MYQKRENIDIVKKLDFFSSVLQCFFSFLFFEIFEIFEIPVFYACSMLVVVVVVVIYVCFRDIRKKLEFRTTVLLLFLQ